MSGCMPGDKPRIAILMAIYEPRIAWLREQLLSLNAQTYPNLVLYIRDDRSPTVSYEEIRSCVQDCISAFPYTIQRNERNLGSNGTFERLTQEAEGEYFAYCDQDDVWLPEKLEVLKQKITESGALLVCSDMYIVDGTGQQKSDSITKVRRHHIFHSGDGLAEGLLFHNFVTGCTMLVRVDQAKAAVPFCPHMLHDHYIALWCAAHGRVLSLKDRLIRYRIHGNNQTGLLAGVTDKKSYGEVRIDAMADRLEWLQVHFPSEGDLSDVLEQANSWARARQANWKGGRGKKTVWRYRKFSVIPSVFELVAEKIPEAVFHWFLRQGQENKI